MSSRNRSDDFDDKDLKESEDNSEKNDSSSEEVSKNINTDIDLDSLNITEQIGNDDREDEEIEQSESINDDIDFNSLEPTGHVEDAEKEQDDYLNKKYRKNQKTGSTQAVLITQDKPKEYKQAKKKDSTNLDYSEDYEENEEVEINNEDELEFSEDAGKTAITGVFVDDTSDEESDSLEFKDGAETQISNTEHMDSDATFIDAESIQAKLTVKTGKLKKKVFSLTNDTIVLGRSMDADITVPDTRASRKHAQITFADGNFIIEDLNSGNGIKVNGHVVDKYLLHSQDKISIGNTVLEFIVVDPSEFETPDEASIALDFDPDAPTQVGTRLNKEETVSNLDLAAFQAAETEVVGEGTVGVSNNTLESSYYDDNFLSDTAFNTSYTTNEDLLAAGEVEKPKKNVLKSFYLIIALFFVIALIAIVWMYSADRSEKKEIANVQKSNLRETLDSGLTVEEEELAVKYYNSAKAYYEGEEYQNAITEAKRAIDIYPGFIQAREIIKYSHEALDEQKTKALRDEERFKQEEHFNEMEDLLNEADRLLIAKKYRQALIPIKNILKLEEDHDEALAMLEEAQAGLKGRKQSALARIQARKEMLNRFQAAEKLYKKKDYIKALKAYNRVLVMGRRTSPGTYDKAKTRYKTSEKRIIKKLKPKIIDAQEKMNTLDYSSSLKILNSVLKKYPAHKKAKTLRVKAFEELTLQVRKIYQEALVMESINDLEDANEGYQKILKLAPSDHEYYKKSLEKLKKYN